MTVGTIVEPLAISDAARKEPKKCVVLLSGGIDSATLLYKLVFDYECYPLSIKYGQRHEKEIVAARNLCEARNANLLLRWKLADLSSLGLLLKSTLTGYGDIPEGHYQAENMKQTVVPNRNMIFLAVAAGYAQTIEAGYVAYAAHAGDHYIYADCRPEFIKSAAKTIKLATEVELIEPFMHVNKTDIVKMGRKLNVPYRLTWSCYKGGDRHCGRCGSCNERKEAFREAGVEDPTTYEE